MIYADTSFLFSLYAWDANTFAAEQLYDRDGRRPLLFTPWQRFELRNTVRLAANRVRHSRSSVHFQVGNVLKRIEGDLASGRLRHEESDSRATFRLAEAFSELWTEELGMAAVDVWHVAAAAQLRADTFWTFDDDQHRLAKAVRRFQHVPLIAH